jgi:hypothetical protein
MRIAKGFNLMNIAEQNIIVPVGIKNVNFNKMVSLNNSGAFLWRQLQEDKSEEALLQAMLEEYDIDEKTAAEDIDRFLVKLRDAGVLE